jgi:hypothetical protein
MLAFADYCPYIGLIMSAIDTPEKPGTPLAAARDLWSRAVAQLDVGTLSQRGYDAIEEKLRAIRSTLEMPERSRIDVYLELLHEAWQDRSPRPSRRPRPSRLVVDAHRVVASGFAEGGDRDARRRRARTALRELERLATFATDDAERLNVVRLAEPLLRLLFALDRTPDDQVLQ